MVILETERLLLRKYTMADFPALYAILSDPVTMQHYPKPYDEAGTRRWIEWNLENYRLYGFGLWAMVRKDTGEMIGDCGLTMQKIDGQNLPEIGYHVRKDCWRQGYGSEAAKAVRDWTFLNNPYACVYSYMKDTNLPSQKTASAMGMRKIKEYPDSKDGILCVYAITRREWQKLHQ